MMEYLGRTYTIKTREMFGEFSASIDAECTGVSAFTGLPCTVNASVRGADSEAFAIEALKALIAEDQAKWEAANPHWGKIPNGVQLGEAIEGWPCDLCAGVTHRTNVKGTRTCGRCGESWGLDGHVSRREVELWATNPEKAAALDVIAGGFV